MTGKQHFTRTASKGNANTRRPHCDSIGGLPRKAISGKAQVLPENLTWNDEPRKHLQRIFLFLLFLGSMLACSGVPGFPVMFEPRETRGCLRNWGQPLNMDGFPFIHSCLYASPPGTTQDVDLFPCAHKGSCMATNANEGNTSKVVNGHESTPNRCPP